jgi:hypothetical protein
MKSMGLRTIYFGAAMAAAILSIPLSADAAGTSARAKFSFDGLATCQNPPVSNFPIHGEGEGVLSTDRSASLDMNSTVEGRVQYQAKLGGPPTAAPEGSASIRVIGRHTLRAVRDYPNNYIAINLTVRGNACSITIENRLKPGRRQYTFYNGSSLSYCSKPIITRASCEGY